MIPIAVLRFFRRIKEEVSRNEFENDAGDRPYVHFTIPIASSDDHLGGTILSRLNAPEISLADGLGISEIDQLEAQIGQCLRLRPPLGIN